jgi:hypothetical protein
MNRYRLVRIYRRSQETVCSECRHPLRVGDYHLEPPSRDAKRVWCSERCAAAAARAGRQEPKRITFTL